MNQTVEQIPQTPVDPTPTAFPKVKSFTLVSFLFFVAVIAILSTLAIYLNVNKSTSKTITEPAIGETTDSSPQPTQGKRNLVNESASETQIRKNDVLLKLGVGYQIALDKSWDVKIIESGKQHNFLTAGVSSSGARIEVEAFSHSLLNWERYLNNDLYEIEAAEIKKIGGNYVKVETGKEAFAQSRARLKIGTWDNLDKTLIVRVIASNQTLINSLFDQLSSSVVVNTVQSKSFQLVRESLAAESTVPNGLPGMVYKMIEVMGEPLEETITQSDPIYKDGYAKGYKFVAFKSQKLASYAEEDGSSGGSYIRSQLFDSNGNPLSGEMDTHIEFKATYTGEYFLIVRTFNQQGGRTTVRVDDHDQLGCNSIIKYPDGAELAINPEERAGGGDVIVGAFEVGYVYQCPKPITLVNNTTVQVENIPRRPNEQSRLMSWEVNVWVSADLYKPKEGVGSPYISAEDSVNNKTGFKLEQIGANRVLITPENGLFLKNRQVAIRGWGSRFFTQAKLTPPDLPILKELLEKFSDEFQPTKTYDFAAVEPMYFDWKNDDNVETEILGGQLWYRKAIISNDDGKGLIEKYKQYFIGKGYTVSDKNNYQGASAKNSSSVREVVGLTLGQTVCKAILDASIFSINCGPKQ